MENKTINGFTAEDFKEEVSKQLNVENYPWFVAFPDALKVISPVIGTLWWEENKDIIKKGFEYNDHGFIVDGSEIKITDDVFNQFCNFLEEAQKANLLDFNDFKAEVLYETQKLPMQSLNFGNLKSWEIAIQNAVEKYLGGKCWWDAVPQQIFSDLLSGKSAVEEMKDVCTSLNSYLYLKQQAKGKDKTIISPKEYIEQGGKTTGAKGVMGKEDKEKEAQQISFDDCTIDRD